MAEIESMVVSPSGTKYPRSPSLCEEALQERELVWARLPKTIYPGTMSCLSVRDCLNLDSAMTNGELRPHLVKAYKDLESPAFNGYLYTDEEDFRVLRWVMERGINLRGFSIVAGTWPVGCSPSAGPALVRLIGETEEDGDREMAEYFAFRGKLVDVDATHKESTALAAACRKGYAGIVKELLAAGADFNARSGVYTSLMYAAQFGHVKIIKTLLDAGADKNEATNFGGSTSLAIAAKHGSVDAVKELLAAGASTENANNHGNTALTLAIIDGHSRCVEELLAAGANIEHADNFGNTGLICAAMINKVEIAKVLLAAGADKDKADSEGRTAMDWAEKRSHHEIIRLLQ